MGHREEERNTNLREILAEGYCRCRTGVRVRVLFCFFGEDRVDGGGSRDV